ncbi:MAG TPA: thiamine pyrophosphate-dependent enzyme, partial [Polyangia bacterium]|nr:thiamine pyrophosphate-dependent enzyme [Polyangia bacterium]
MVEPTPSGNPELDGLALENLAFAEELYFQYLRDPASVDPEWRRTFAALDSGAGRNGAGPGGLVPPAAFPRSIFAGRGATNAATVDGPPASPPGAIQSRISMRLLSERVQRLIEAYREMGHLFADLDPLGLTARRSPQISLEDYGLTDEDLDLVFSSENVAGPTRKTLRDLISQLRETYCRTIGVQTSHLHDLELRAWLQTRMESARNRLPMTRADRIRVFQQVIGAEVFEQFLQNKFLGSKRFSLEGAESLIPLLERLVERAARSSVGEIVIGMAHRGRLNVLANVLKKPASQIFAEFQDKLDEKADLSDGGGDVKYHLGFSIDRVFGEGSDEHRVHLSLTFNPSHLEWVNTVVQGRVRAKQDRLVDTARTRALPILIHGDAAFAGQGIIAESLNMSELDGYRVGGTVHIVVNNQIGFTTAPQDGRSTRYCTDVAKMIEVPIFHVNGEDPEAVAHVVELAMEYRRQFRCDVVIDMFCFRKYGHNEGD